MKPLEEILELSPFLSFDLHNNYFPKNDRITLWLYHDLFFMEAQFLKIPSNDIVTYVSRCIAIVFEPMQTKSITET